MSSWCAMSALGHNQTWRPEISMSATSESGHCLAKVGCPLCAKSRHWPGRTMALPSAAFLPCPPWDKDQRV
jgi:hypothetical protein